MPTSTAKPRGEWCKMWKSVSSRRLTQVLKIAPPLWQADTFDHILRSEESYAGKWQYVLENPVRRGLCRRAEDWPWQGEIHSLRA